MMSRSGRSPERTPKKGRKVPPALPPKSIKGIDLHLHAGQERDVPMKQLVQSFVDRGISFLGLLDHSELYEMGDEALRAEHGQVVYPSSTQGLISFYREVDGMKHAFRGTASIYSGLEVGEWDILRVSRDFILDPDFVGCHMNTSCHDPNYRHYENASCGGHLARRARELLGICRPVAKPAVLFHPFHRRLQELRALIQTQGNLADEELFTKEDAATFIDGVDLQGLYVELNFGDLYTAATHPDLLKLLRRTCLTFKHLGLGFSLGSDYHKTPQQFRDPTELVESLGLGLKDFSLAYHLADQE